MADLALVWRDLAADCAVADADLALDDTLQTAVILSLFLDRRARPDDVIPDGTGNPRGWWADTILRDDAGRYDQHGSRLWLLSREKQMVEVLRRAKDYADEGLAWLLEDGLATKIEVTPSNPRDGILWLDIVITLPDGTLQTYRYGTELDHAV